MPATEVRAEFWMHEYITPWDFYAHGITRVLAYRRTAFQEMYIVETGAYGKALVLDGKWQSCTGDEFLYHEPLVHPALLLHGSPRSVLILGGGEGATAREVLRWKSVRRVTMIDIDGDVVAACREHLPEMHEGAFDDSRVDLIVADALTYLDKTNDTFDVVISDLSDPIEEGPSFKLFTKEYFAKARRVLDPAGVFVVQAGPVSPAEMHLHCRLASTLRTVFDDTASLTTYVPTYAAPWSFVLASGRPIDTRPDPAEIDGQLAEKTTGGLRMLDGTALLGLYQLPKHLRQAVAEETHVYTLAQPPRFFGKGVVAESGGD
jgi:spermidine synthase